jgi:hypothetical protein
MLITCGILHQARVLAKKKIKKLFGSVINVSIFVLPQKKYSFHNKKQTV